MRLVIVLNAFTFKQLRTGLAELNDREEHPIVLMKATKRFDCVKHINSVI